MYDELDVYGEVIDLSLVEDCEWDDYAPPIQVSTNRFGDAFLCVSQID